MVSKRPLVFSVLWVSRKMSGVWCRFVSAAGDRSAEVEGLLAVPSCMGHPLLVCSPGWHVRSALLFYTLALMFSPFVLRTCPDVYSKCIVRNICICAELCLAALDPDHAKSGLREMHVLML